MIPPLEIQSRIDAHTLVTHQDERRTYLGASVIGEKCVRKLWYQFRWCGTDYWEPRMLRLFARGDREEHVLIDLLRGAGFTVRTPLEDGPEDFQFQDCEGHFAGTADGAISPETLTELLDNKMVIEEAQWFCLSFKTYNKKNFADLKRCGVKENDPKYWHQEQTYMGELGFEWTLFCAVCKDDDELYFEWLPFNQIDFSTNLNKAETIINAQTPPERISNDPKTWTCRYCQFNRICHENTPIPPSLRACRNCAHASPGPAGSWDCAKGHAFGTLCPDYNAIAGGSAAA